MARTQRPQQRAIASLHAVGASLHPVNGRQPHGRRGLAPDRGTIWRRCADAGSGDRAARAAAPRRSAARRQRQGTARDRRAAATTPERKDARMEATPREPAVAENSAARSQRVPRPHHRPRSSAADAGRILRLARYGRIRRGSRRDALAGTVRIRGRPGHDAAQPAVAVALLSARQAGARTRSCVRRQTLGLRGTRSRHHVAGAGADAVRRRVGFRGTAGRPSPRS